MAHTAAVAHVLICLDKLKGSLTAVCACAALAEGLRAEGCLVVERPVADGGEGTVDALVRAGWQRVEQVVDGPTGQPVRAAFALRGARGVVELAQASGLDLLPGGVPAPLEASTYGTGQLLSAALDAGCSELVLAVGGSATTDGGSGMLQALGAELLDRHGAPVGRGGGALGSVARVRLHGLDPRLSAAHVILASDVDNPLLGERGAAAVFGPQKGADRAQVALLEAGLARFAGAVADELGADHAASPGAGAAGGAGFAALAGLGATRRSGADLLLDELGVRAQLGDAVLVVVGEGRLDAQSLAGKAPVRVAALAGSAGVPVVAVAGRVDLNDAQLAAAGIGAAYALVDLAPDEQTAVREAARLLTQVGRGLASGLPR
jgi:glycerate kinase